MQKAFLFFIILSVSIYAQDSLKTFDTAMAYLLGKGVIQNKHKAFILLKKASKEGSSEAQYNLALMYYMGDGIDQNITRSAELLDSSAQQGYKKAIENVGRVYMQLLKFDKAQKWLKQNAKDGDSEANYLLAEIYVEKGDLKSAKIYAKKALDNGNPQAQELWNQYKLSTY